MSIKTPKCLATVLTSNDELATLMSNDSFTLPRVVRLENCKHCVFLKFIHSLLLAAQLSTLSICSFVYACSRGREVSLHTITASSAYRIVSELTLFGRSFIYIKKNNDLTRYLAGHLCRREEVANHVSH